MCPAVSVDIIRTLGPFSLHIFFPLSFLYQLYFPTNVLIMSGDYRGDKVAQVAILFLALTWISVSLRVYVRGFMTKSFGIDDWLAIVTLVCDT